LHGFSSTTGVYHASTNLLRSLSRPLVRSLIPNPLPPFCCIHRNYNYLFNAGCCDKIYPPSAPGQIALTLDQYHDVMMATMAEIWGRYKGEIFEIWFVSL
jgi:hypothetical protein